jgi:hypothetical protein
MFRLQSTLKPSTARISVLGVIACGLLNAGAQDALEFQELQNNLRTAYAKIQALETAAKAGGAPTVALQESTAAAQAEAAELKERYLQLRGLLDALDISAIENGGDEKANRLIASLNDLRMVKEEQKRLADALFRLLEASMEFSQVATPGNPESVAKLGTAMQTAEAALKSSIAHAGDPAKKELTAASVVSVKPELGVVVLDVGTKDGAKPGMPFNIFRADKPIARVLVTDVRSTVSGAVIRELFSPSDKLMIGDRGQADASQSF